MTKTLTWMVIIFLLIGSSCNRKGKESNDSNDPFPSAMVDFSPAPVNPVFQGAGPGTWDKDIRERGFILYEEGTYRMWYTGYNDSLSEYKYLGYATSSNGTEWDRYPGGPIVDDTWVEDMFVIRYDGLYYMMAEGRDDIAHWLTSTDGIEWEPQGNLVIMKENGEPIDEGPYGTPTLWIEDGKKYLFYERNDEAIWLATSSDFKHWTNVQDEPILKPGPEEYDKGAVAVNQIIRFQGKYYMYYHASTSSDWMDPNANALWSSNVAVSDNLTDWVKYPDNPIVEGDHSSPILVYDDKAGEYFLFTMHDKVWRYTPE